MLARRTLLAVSVCLATLLAGCTQFHGTKRLDAGSFADNTVSMAGEIQRYNRPPPWVHLNEFRTRASVEAARKTAVVLRDLLRSISLYSTQVVALSESRIDEEHKIAELAGYIEEVTRPGILSGSAGKIGITDEEFRATLAAIRSKKTLREGLGAAQPLVNAVANYANDVFNHADSAVADAYEDLAEQIEIKFKPVTENMRDLDSLQSRLTKCFGLVHDLRGGRSAALTELTDTVPEVRPRLPSGSEPTFQDLEQLEGWLVAELGRVKEVRTEADRRFVEYKEHRQELEALRLQTEDMLRLGRVTMSVWVRSHRNLAAGIAVPPQVDILKVIDMAAKVGKAVL